MSAFPRTSACRSLAIAVLALCNACWQPTRTSFNPPALYSDNPVATTRSAADCAAVVKSAYADTVVRNGTTLVNGTTGPLQKRLTNVDMTKMPKSSIGTTSIVVFQVNELGEVMPHTANVLNVTDRTWVKELKDSAGHNSYFPAVREGCAVPSWTSERIVTRKRVPKPA